MCVHERERERVNLLYSACSIQSEVCVVVGGGGGGGEREGYLSV